MAPTAAPRVQVDRPEEPSSTDRPRQPAIPEDDPVWQAFLRAPVVEVSPEERALFEEERRVYNEARADGRMLSTAEILAGLERRRECAGK